MNLKGSKTEQNILKAYIAESKARNRYKYYEEKAREENLEQIANIFKETADNEETHAKIWYELAYDKIPSSEKNLKDAANYENYEWVDMYAKMAYDAESEGFLDIARLFRCVAEIEQRHEQRFLDLLNNMQINQIYEKPEVVSWKCEKCGHIHNGNKVPDICPVCKNQKKYFKLYVINY